jgi:hypothetical protein
MDLQNETDVEKDLPDLCKEACLRSSQDAIEVMIMKVKEVSGMQEEAVPVPKTWHAVKDECEVSCDLSAVKQTGQMYRMGCCLSLLHLPVCLSVCLQETKPL